MDPKKRKYKNQELAKFHPDWIQQDTPVKTIREKLEPPKLTAFCEFVKQQGSVAAVLAALPVSFSDLEEYIRYYGEIPLPQFIGLIVSILEGTYSV